MVPVSPLIALLCVVAFGAAMPARAAVAEEGTPAVRFGVAADPKDRRFDFAAELLEAALRAGGSAAPVERVGGMNQRRMIQAAGEGALDVLMLPSVRKNDATLRPIPFPLRRGLLGVRLLLATPGTADGIAHIGSLAELKRDYTLGYGHEWLDREEMAALGFRIETANSYRGLFDMLRGGRFDYLSRGVNEIEAELADTALAGSGLVVVPNIALFYPLDDYFFLPEGRDVLRATIERGLERMLEDGRYNRLLAHHFGDAMRAARLDERSVLHVLGYPIPAGTPMQQFDILQPVRSDAVFRPPGDAR